MLTKDTKTAAEEISFDETYVNWFYQTQLG